MSATGLLIPIDGSVNFCETFVVRDIGNSHLKDWSLINPYKEEEGQKRF